MRHAMRVGGLAVLTIASVFPQRSAAQSSAQRPETVMVTYHAKVGGEAALASVIAKHWKTAVELKLVLETPHVVVRGEEEGTKAYFVEIFTWRDGAIPDSPPAAIQGIWSEMGALVEPRGGGPGIRIVQVSLATP